MADIFKLMGRIAIDASGADADIDRITQKAQLAGKKINNSFEKIGKSFKDTTKGIGQMGKALIKVGETTERVGRTIAKGITVGATAVGAAAATIGKNALDIRSSIEQGLGGADAVFQQYAHHIKDSSKDAWKTAGLSVEEYLSTANKMGSLFKGAGFSEMQAVEMTANAMQRAADVASIMGIDVSVAMESIAGAAKGNFTMMDNLGVAMNDTTLEAYRLEKGMNQAVSTMTTAEKVELAMQMFFDKTADYAGNYAKENETAAGSLQTLKAAWSNFLGGVGTFDDLEQSAFGYLRIAAKTMGLEGFEPMINGAQQTVQDVAEILSMEGLDGRQKYAQIRRYLLEKSVTLANSMGGKIVNGISNVSSLIGETLSDINLNLPGLLNVGREVFASVRTGVLNAANELKTTAAIISPDIISGWFTMKTDFISIGLDILGAISDGITEDFAKGEESLVGTSLKEGLHKLIDSAAKNLPKMANLATALIDGISDALTSTDENGKKVGEKAGEIVENIIGHITAWIKDGGVGRFTSAAAEFMGAFAAELVVQAPVIFEGVIVGILNGFESAFKKVLELLGIDWLNEELTPEQIRYLENAPAVVPENAVQKLNGKYAHWTEEQKTAAEGYIWAKYDGHSTTEDVAKLQSLGITDEALAMFQEDVSNALASGEFEVSLADAWFEPQVEEQIQKTLSAMDLYVNVNARINEITGDTNGEDVDGSHANGLDFVPRDNYIARLHYGEMVLTGSEANMYRNGGVYNARLESVVAGLANAISEMREETNTNMNLYINKKHVASAMSRDMGRSIGNREYLLMRGMGG